jgi:FAD/FMN-containing dehydrogenase
VTYQHREARSGNQSEPNILGRREVLQLGAALAVAPGAIAATAKETALARPPIHIEPRHLKQALSEFAQVVGSEWVFTKAEDLELYRDYYSPLWGEPQEKRCSGAVAPSTVEQVQEIARIASAYGVPLYPISTGRNLGYGGSAPVLSGSVVLDLKRMNRIVEVDERNAFALVEPGVSYLDLTRYIRERGLKLWLDVPEPGWGSPIGNALDHGNGFTRADFRNHFDAHCGMEVVLANGDLVRTGMGALPGSRSWQQYKSSFGPMLDGLFVQSNFGIVTKMGFWLMPEPEAMLSGEIYVPRYRDIIPLVDIINRLENSRIFNGMPELGAPLLGMKIGEGPAEGGPPPIHPTVQQLLARGDGFDATALEEIGKSIGEPFWGCRVTFYGPQEVIEAQWRHTQQAFAQLDGVSFKTGVQRTFPLSDVEFDRLKTTEMVTVGRATMKGFSLGPLADLGAVGHVFTSAIIPRTGEAVLEANEVFRAAAKRLGLTPQPIYIPVGFIERSFRLVMSFPVTRDIAANQKMRAQATELMRVAAEHGWGECRTAPAFYDDVMATYAFNNHAHRRLCETLKDAIDPKGILSAGRYGIWPAHLRAKS